MSDQKIQWQDNKTCIICGRKGYPLSVGGSDICPDCDCGGMFKSGRHKFIREDMLESYGYVKTSYLSIQEPRDFEIFLMEKHAEQYIGTKDCMVDDFNKWVCDLGTDEMIEYGNKYSKTLRLYHLKQMEGLDKIIDEVCIEYDCLNRTKNNLLETLQQALSTAIRQKLGVE